jgi:uncharacterized membrane protein YedE/YeeE
LDDSVFISLGRFNPNWSRHNDDILGEVIMENFTPVSALIGGALLGVSATLLLALNGRIAGISGVLAGVLPPRPAADFPWHVLFLVGLVVGVVIHRTLINPDAAIVIAAPTPVLLVAGLLVGLGTGIGSGCTSGHGVCGLSRLSPRSMVATATFMVTSAITVFVVRHVVGGW